MEDESGGCGMVPAAEAAISSAGTGKLVRVGDSAPQPDRLAWGRRIQIVVSRIREALCDLPGIGSGSV